MIDEGGSQAGQGQRLISFAPGNGPHESLTRNCGFRHHSKKPGSRRINQVWFLIRDRIG